VIAVFLADSFEEIEALATVDFLRRCGLEVQTIGIGGKLIRGAHGICVMSDWEPEGRADEIPWDGFEAVVLPGGLPGTTNLEASEAVQCAIEYARKNRLLIAAICAAPSILAHVGLLRGKRATCFPGYEAELLEGGASLGNEYVVEDGDIITARGAGCSLQFAQAIAKRFVGEAKARDTLLAMQLPERAL
jgi:4-methyl-5(b-hydroxyethyl)-thiazole monophosphate biosynthesis